MSAFQPLPVSKWDGKTWVVFGDSNSKDGDAMPKYHHIISSQHNITLYNYAVSGGKWGQDPHLSIDSQIDNAISEADLITFMAGGNDVVSIASGDLPLGTFGDTEMGATYYGCLDYTIGRIIAKYPTKIIGAMSQMKRGEGKEELLQAMVKALKDVCGKYGIPVLDLYNGGNIHAYNQTFLSTYMPDGVHLNALAHEKILAPKVFSFIESL
ncbi:SGNH/GDSL hydrolase family protein [Lederbergia citrea]|uniref:SGNH/GDSL hydrolase family protein n=1 Tax=Lederbergia citrea TaxID=2833581 RepID=UPI001BC91CDD|nr:SGNH/GDSL hydrolase family protein [Lederbergia citrea]MBS4178153.1 SGNH/GDSL hydrolase family protein [Lederbergia citrea]